MKTVRLPLVSIALLGFASLCGCGSESRPPAQAAPWAPLARGTITGLDLGSFSCFVSAATPGSTAPRPAIAAVADSHGRWAWRMQPRTNYVFTATSHDKLGSTVPVFQGSSLKIFAPTSAREMSVAIHVAKA
ncbi:hypothetical protein HNR15_002849 [Allobranchiibius huperziae]|uniref:Uncharacterized protein n=1 Tax=Allobranchiibius huperziae TaxID=1874116 RepID=A0A853DE82_9MICO|nr:hypothetical protein [Allobranchiibius huperziae]